MKTVARHFRALLPGMSGKRSALAEPLERRQLLAAAVSGAIPLSVDPVLAAQLLLPGAATELSLASPGATVHETLYRFVVDDAQPGSLTSFFTGTDAAGAAADAGLALFDQDGNQLAVSDLDANGSKTREELDYVLDSGRPYVLGVYTQAPTAAGATFVLGAVLNEQTANSALHLDPNSATASLSADNGEDALASIYDVDTFPLDLLNAAASATVQLTGTAPDVLLSAAVYRSTAQSSTLGSVLAGDVSWKPVTTGSGAAPTLALTPLASPPDTRLTDETTVLAVAPQDFDAPPRSYQIDVSAAPPILPSTIDPAGATDLGLLVLSGPEALSVSAASSAGPGSNRAYRFRATQTGPLTIKVVSNNANSRLITGVYSQDGQLLSAVMTAHGASLTRSVTIDAQSGAQYVVSLQTDQGLIVPFTMTATQAGQSTGLNLAAGPVSVASFNVGLGTDASVFRLTMPASKVLSLLVTPDAGSAALTVLSIAGANVPAKTFTAAAAGLPLAVTLDSRTFGGEVDVTVTSSAATTDSVTFSAAAIQISDTLVSSLATLKKVDLSTGLLSQSAALGGSASIVAAPLQSLETHANSQLTASSDGAPVALAVYEDRDGILTLSDFAVPGVDGVARLTRLLRTERVAALAAVSLSTTTDAGGNATVTLSSAPPTGAGVQMAPEPAPGQPPTGSFTEVLKIRGATVRSTDSRDLYETLLPYNLLGTPSVDYTSAGGLSLFPPAVTITVLDASNNVLTSFDATGAIGSTHFPLSGAAFQPAALAGKKLRFLVEPTGTSFNPVGPYSLAFTIPTSDPNAWLFQPTENFPATSVSGIVTITTPHIVVTQLNANSTVSGNFTSSQPYNGSPPGGTGSLAIYRMSIPRGTEFEVQTERVDTDPVTPGVQSNLNTTLALYYGVYSGSTLLRLEPAPGFAPNLDYFPADRDAVDAKIVVRNTQSAKGVWPDPNGAGHDDWFAVVKTEQGTTGQFRLRLTTTAPQLVGPLPTAPLSTTLLDVNPKTGDSYGNPLVLANNTLIRFDTRSSLFTFGGVFSSILTVDCGTVTTRTVSVDIYDAAGSLVGTRSASANSATIDISLGTLTPSRTYYLRPQVTSGPAPSYQGFVGNIGVSGSQPLLSASSAVMPTTAPANGMTRASQSPAGTVSQSIPAFGGAMTQDVTLWVHNPGVATFKLVPGLNMQNMVLAIYSTQNADLGPGLPLNRLIDFKSTTSADGSISFDVPVMPGLYIAHVEGTKTGTNLISFSTFTATLPTPFTSPLPLNPSTGSALGGEASSDGLIPPYHGGTEYDLQRTRFYTVVTPGAVLMPMTVTVVGTGTVQIFKQMPGGYVAVSNAASFDGFAGGGVVTATDSPQPGDIYVVSVNPDGLTGTVTTSVRLPVPVSGTPDIVVSPPVLAPDGGITKVSVTVRNQGYADTGASHSQLRLSNVITPVGSLFPFILPPLAALSTQTYVFYWTPGNTGDTFTYTADVNHEVQETNESNNSGTTAITAHKPVVTLTLGDTRLDGDVRPAVWGRYVSGVKGPMGDAVLGVSDPDGDADIYQGYWNIGALDDNPIVYRGGGAKHVLLDFSRFKPTSPSDPNMLRWYAKDQWGLLSNMADITLNVVPKPQFYTSIAWNAQTFSYDLAWKNDIVDFNKTLSQLLGFDVPVVGDKKQVFHIGMDAAGSATLNPAAVVGLPLIAAIQLTVLDQDLYKKEWGGIDKSSSNFYVSTKLDVNAQTLDVAAASASFQLRGENLFHFETPKIKLYSYGIPGIADISANFQFLLDASIDAGLKLGIDPHIFADPLHAPLRIGVMSPTFVAPSVTGTAKISGDVSVLGFDLAELEGHVSLTLTLTVGLDNGDRNAIIPFTDIFSHIGVGLSADLAFGFSASHWGLGTIWSWDPDPIHIPIFSTFSHFIGDDGASTPPGGHVPPNSLTSGNDLATLLNGQLSPGVLAQLHDQADQPPTVRGGHEALGAYALDPAPQLAIDPTTGDAMAVQLVDLDPSETSTLSGIAFSTRTGAAGAWSALDTIPGVSDVMNPVLVRPNDGSSNHFLLMYEKVDDATAPENQTPSERLAARRLRYRMFDGNTWGSEQTLTEDGTSTSDASASFNDAGQGTMAWVKNGSADPVSAAGQFDRGAQEIAVASWDAGTQSWTGEQVLTSDAVSDDRPTTFVDSDGKQYVVWMRDTVGSQNELWFSTNDGGGWTTPAMLPTTGLAPGGTFSAVSMGSEAAGRVDVLFNYRRPNGDGTIDSVLYNRPALSGSFDQPTTLEIVSRDADYSHLRTTNSADRLVASWQQSDGVTDEIFTSSLASGGRWTTPMRITNDDGMFEQRPSVAVEPDGTIRALYEAVDADTGLPLDTAPDAGEPPTTGSVGGMLADVLPQIDFAKQLTFDDPDAIATGQLANASATIVNHGLAATDVTLDWYAGDPQTEPVLKTETIHLSPNASYVSHNAFSVIDGPNTFYVVAHTDGPQSGGVNSVTSSYLIVGKPDVQLVSVTAFSPSTPIGPGNPLQVTVLNRGGTSIDSFDVALFAGDPIFDDAVPVIDTQTITDLGAGQSTTLTFFVSTPATAGHAVFAFWADSGQVLDESSEGNNRASYERTWQADPRVSAAPTITLTDAAGGVGAVGIDFNVRNDTGIDAGSVLASLYRATDDDDAVLVGQSTIMLGAHDLQGVHFTGDGLAGMSIFQVVLTPMDMNDDLDLTNNSADATLVLAGLPDLSFSAGVVLPPDAQGTASVNFTLANLGIAKATDVLVEVLATDVDGNSTIIGTMRVARSSALSSAALQIDLDTSALDGVYVFSLQVDRLDDYLEVDETNNSFTLGTFGFGVLAPPKVTTTAFEHLGSSQGVVLTFDEDVFASLGTDDFLLENLTNGATFTSDQFAIEDLGGNAVRITWPGITGPAGAGILPDGNYRLTVVASGVTNVGGIPMSQDRVLQFRFFNADATDDGHVDFTDLLLLAQNYGQSGRSWATGDFTYDGVVNFTDLLLLAQQYGKSLAVLGSPLVTAKQFAYDTTAPQEIRFSFDHDVSGSLLPGSLVLTNLTSGLTIPNTQYSVVWTAATQTAAFRMTGVTGGIVAGALPAGRYHAALAAAGVVANGVPMAADATLDFTFLPGDANADGSVNFSDLLVLSQNYGQTPRAFSQGDFNYDHSVDFADLLLLAQKYGTTLAATTAPTDESDEHPGDVLR